MVKEAKSGFLYEVMYNYMGKRNLTKAVSSCGEGKLSLGSYEVMYSMSRCSKNAHKSSAVR